MTETATSAAVASVPKKPAAHHPTDAIRARLQRQYADLLTQAVLELKAIKDQESPEALRTAAACALMSGMTKVDLGRLLDLGGPTMHRWVLGRDLPPKAIPRHAYFQAIVRILGRNARAQQELAAKLKV